MWVRCAALWVTLAVAAAIVGGCGGGIEAPLERAAASSTPPDDLRVVYDDYHPSWGGSRIEIRGDGRIAVATWRPGQPESEPDTHAGTVPRSEIGELARLLVEIEAWEQRVEEDASRIDAAKARLDVRIGRERAVIWEWSNDLEANGRLVRVARAVEALARGARRSAP